MKTLGIASLLIATLMVLGAALANPAAAAGPSLSAVLSSLDTPMGQLPGLLPSGNPKSIVYLGNGTRGDLKFIIHAKGCGLVKIPKNTLVNYCTFNPGKYQWEAWGWCGRPVYAAGSHKYLKGKWLQSFRCG